MLRREHIFSSLYLRRQYPSAVFLKCTSYVLPHFILMTWYESRHLKSRKQEIWYSSYIISVLLFLRNRNREHSDIAIFSNLKFRRNSDIRTALSSVYIQFAEDSLHFVVDNVFWCLSIVGTLLTSDHSGWPQQNDILSQSEILINYV